MTGILDGETNVLVLGKFDSRYGTCSVGDVDRVRGDIAEGTGLAVVIAAAAARRQERVA